MPIALEAKVMILLRKKAYDASKIFAGKILRGYEKIVFFFEDGILLFKEFLGRNERVIVNRVGLPIIISLTSIPGRLNTLHFTIESLFRQTQRADQVILWLSEKIDANTLPKRLQKQEKRGLIIKFREDVGPHTKIHHALKEFPESIIVTCDDDKIYPSDWLTRLYQAHLKASNCVVCHRAHEITIDEAGSVEAYERWSYLSPGRVGPSHFLFATGVDGVLYPPSVLHADVLNKELFQKICPLADDVWLNVMAILKNTPRKKANPYSRECRSTTGVELGGLYVQNYRGGGNDKQMKSVLQHYGLEKYWSKKPE